MKSIAAVVATLVVLASTTNAANDTFARVTGEYVEARTAEVFAGGCIMNSEAETTGRQALLAWRVTHGEVGGSALDGLAVVVAVAGDRNLGMREMGGEAPAVVRAAIMIDARASEAQRSVLERMARSLSAGLVDPDTRVESAPIHFESNGTSIAVRVGDTVSVKVTKEMTHDPSCGAMQWFKPFSPLTTSAMGMTEENAYSGTALGSKWSVPNKRSSFWGTFSYDRSK